MEPKRINDDYTVSGQITPDEAASLADAGYAVVICNRPDNEDPGQPSAALVRAAAEGAGLVFHHIPVVSGAIPEQAVGAMAEALKAAEGPVFAYCRSGARSTNLYAMAQARGA